MPTNNYVLGTVLASSSGTAGIGYNQGSTGAVNTTVQTVLNSLTVSNIASLRLLTKGAYSTSIVIGYYTAGDGGGGVYWYNSTDTSSADNGGTIIVASDGGRWYLSSQLFYSIKQFGAYLDNSHDDTVAIQSAITVLQGTGAMLFIPKGTAKVSATINITGSIRISGESRYGSSFTWTSTTLNVFSVASDAPVRFEHLTFSGPLSATSGYMILLTGASTQNLFSVIEDCSFAQGFNHVTTISAADFSIIGCYFSNYVGVGAYISDTYNPDSGDSYIGFCTFSTSSASANGIWQVSSGGLKVEGNKIVGGAYGYLLQIASTGSSTIDLIIVGNSIENQVTAGIYLQQPSGTNTFGNVVISGNQISNQPIGIKTDPNANWLSRLAIIGNQITLASLSTNSGICVNIGGSSNFIIDGNQLSVQPNSTFTSYGIAIGAAALNGKIGVNQYYNLGAGSMVKVSNGSASTVVVNDTTEMGTSGTIVATTGYGAAFFGSVSVTFPTAFNIVPVVTCFPTGANGMSAWPSTISVSGFTLNMLCSISTASTTATWAASGVT